MSDRKTTPPFSELPFKEMSEQWVSACFMPWNTLQNWNVFWGDQWKDWMKRVASAPNPWLGPLAGGRTDQRAEIDFFLPWLPRVESVFTSDSASPDKALMSAMVRAALLPLRSMSPMNLERDAAETAARAPQAQTPAPQAAAPASSKTVKKASRPAARKPAKPEVLEPIPGEAVATNLPASPPVVDIATQLQAANAAPAANATAPRKRVPKSEPDAAAPKKPAARKRAPVKPKPAGESGA